MNLEKNIERRKQWGDGLINGKFGTTHLAAGLNGRTLTLKARLMP
jgi:hypothetical protein